MKHTLKWFKNRIGKIIYRKITWCQCDMCNEPSVKVYNLEHAEYLFDCQNELDIDYQDKPIKPTTK
jgi:hypothetical protein